MLSTLTLLPHSHSPITPHSPPCPGITWPRFPPPLPSCCGYPSTYPSPNPDLLVSPFTVLLRLPLPPSTSFPYYPSPTRSPPLPAPLRCSLRQITSPRSRSLCTTASSPTTSSPAFAFPTPCAQLSYSSYLTPRSPILPPPASSPRPPPFATPPVAFPFTAPIPATLAPHLPLLIPPSSNSVSYFVGSPLAHACVYRGHRKAPLRFQGVQRSLLRIFEEAHLGLLKGRCVLVDAFLLCAIGSFLSP